MHIRCSLRSLTTFPERQTVSKEFIVIEGMDGSGKETQTKLLEQCLSEKGVNTISISFPRYGSKSAFFVEDYLKGEFGEHAEYVNPYGASSFFAIDRYVSYLKEWRKLFNSADVFLADRYTTSNAIYQCSKLPNDQWESFCDWLFDFEYNKLCLPKPTKVIYLVLELAACQKLLKHRYSGDRSKLDVHERNMEFLEKSSQVGQWCCKHFNWKQIVCTDNDGNLRTPADIHDEIVQFLGY